MTIQIQAGQTAKIISKFSNSIPATYHFSATTATGGDAPTGTVEIKASTKAVVTQPLAAENSVSKSMFDATYSVHVTPDQDVTITMGGGNVKSPLRFVAIVVVIVAVAAVFMLLGAGPR